MKPQLLAIDAGTTGVTAILFDRDLFPVARAYREFPQHYPAPGQVEHLAPEILGALDTVLAELFDGLDPSTLVAVGLTNQRETVFALERATGQALLPGIVWQDRRTEARCAELEAAGLRAQVRAKTGLLIDPYFSATKIEWLLGQGDLSRRAQAGEVVFATVDTLVLHHLRGGGPFLTDPTNAARTMLFDIDRRVFDPELCELFGVPPTSLAEVLPSTGDFGTTLPERTGGRALPIRGLAGDQQAALFGQGGFEAGAFKATFGTGSFLLLHTGEDRRDSERGLVTTLAVGRDGGATYACEGSVFICGAAVQWLRDELGLVESAPAIEALASSVPDSGGVTFVPAFAGLGAPYWDPGARGALLGLSRGSGRAHVARATLEAMAFQNAELVELMREDSGLAIESVRVDGGAASNDLLMQLQADLAGIRVVRGPEVEATARGAAALAGVGSGLLQDPSEAAALRHGEDREFLPRLEPSRRAARLAEWRSAVARVRSAPGSGS